MHGKDERVALYARLNVALRGLVNKVQGRKKRQRRSKVEMIKGGLTRTQKDRLTAIIQKHVEKGLQIPWKKISEQVTFSGLDPKKLQSLGKTLFDKAKSKASCDDECDFVSNGLSQLFNEISKMEEKLRVHEARSIRYDQNIQELNDRCAALSESEKKTVSDG